MYSILDSLLTPDKFFLTTFLLEGLQISHAYYAGILSVISFLGDNDDLEYGIEA